MFQRCCKQFALCHLRPYWSLFSSLSCQAPDFLRPGTPVHCHIRADQVPDFFKTADSTVSGAELVKIKAWSMSEPNLEALSGPIPSVSDSQMDHLRHNFMGNFFHQNSYTMQSSRFLSSDCSFMANVEWLVPPTAEHCGHCCHNLMSSETQLFVLDTAKGSIETCPLR